MESAGEGITTPRYSTTTTRFSSSSLQGVPGDSVAPTISDSPRSSYPGRSVSRLRASSLELDHGLTETLAEGPEQDRHTHETQDSSIVCTHDSDVADQAHGDTAENGVLPEQRSLAEANYGLHTVISGQGLSLPADTAQPDGSAPVEQSSDASRDVPSSLEGNSLPAGTAPGLAGGGGTELAVEGGFKLEVVADADEAVDAELAADTDIAKRKHKLRQHAWLLYFYDRSAEADYANYHASQMLKVRVMLFCILL